MSTPLACNVVIYDMVGIYTLRNYGRRINCTATFIYPLAYQIVSMNIGKSYRPIESLMLARNYVIETGIIKKVMITFGLAQKGIANYFIYLLLYFICPIY